MPSFRGMRQHRTRNHDGNGFRVSLRAADDDVQLNALRRADPIAVEAVGHAVAEMHQRDGP